MWLVQWWCLAFLNTSCNSWRATLHYCVPYRSDPLAHDHDNLNCKYLHMRLLRSVKFESSLVMYDEENAPAVFAFRTPASPAPTGGQEDRCFVWVVPLMHVYRRQLNCCSLWYGTVFDRTAQKSVCFGGKIWYCMLYDTVQYRRACRMVGFPQDDTVTRTPQNVWPTSFPTATTCLAPVSLPTRHLVCAHCFW